MWWCQNVIMFIICLEYASKVNYTFFFISNSLKLAKNQARTKQHPEAELWLFGNFSLSLSTLSSKNIRRYFKECTKNKCVCLNEVTWLMAMKMKLKMKNRLYRYDISRPSLHMGTDTLNIK